MNFFAPVWFRAELPQPAIMEFNGRTAPECYCLIPVGGSIYYGMVISEDMIEYFTNEFIVHSLEIVTSAELKKLIERPGCKVWGNQDLVNF